MGNSERMAKKQKRARERTLRTLRSTKTYQDALVAARLMDESDLARMRGSLRSALRGSNPFKSARCLAASDELHRRWDAQWEVKDG